MVNNATVDFSSLLSLAVDGGTAHNVFNVSGTPSFITTTLNSGTGNDTTNVAATGSTSTLDVNGQGGTDTVDLTNAGSAQGLNGTITIGNVGGSTALTVDDSADTTGRAVTIGATSLTGTMVNGTTVNYANLSSLHVDGGSGGNSFTVNGTPSAITTTLDSGSGDNTTNVTATGTTSTLDIDGQGGADAVDLGSGRHAQALNGTISVTNAAGGATALTVNDSSDTTSRSITMSGTSMTGTMVNDATVDYNHLSALTVDGGSGGNVFTVTNTRTTITTTLNTGTGADLTTIEATRDGTLDINGQDGHDGVFLTDSGSAQNFNGTINVGNAAGATALTVDDSADDTGQSLSMDDTQLSGSLVNTAFVNYANLSALNIFGGSGGNCFTVNSTPASITTTINKGSGPINSVNVFGTMAGSTLDLTGTGGPDSVTLGPGLSGKVNIDEAPGSTSW